MKLAAFAYHRPTSVDEAVRTLADVAEEDGRVLAGGQSLIPVMAFRLARPAHLVDINDVEAFQTLRVDGDRLRVGACVRHQAFAAGAIEGPTGVLLARVMRCIAHPPIRARGSFCGSLANADPASEWCATAVALGATLIAQSRRGLREIAADNFFQGVMATDLQADELLVEAHLPLLAPDARVGFAEFSRRAGDYAIAMVLATLRVEGGRIVDPRVCVGGAESRPRRLPRVEAALAGAPLDQETLARAADLAAETLDPLEDLATSGDYRRSLVRKLARDALEQVRHAPR